MTPAAARPTRADLIATAAAPAFPDETWGTTATDTPGTVAVLEVVVAARVVAKTAKGAATGDAEMSRLANRDALPRTASCPPPRTPRRPAPAPRPAEALAALALGTPSAGVDDSTAVRDEPCAGPRELLEGDPALFTDPVAPPEPPVSAAATPGIANIAAPIPRAAASAPTRPTTNLGTECARPPA